ncbi:MAG: CPBP family intramembrane metalloprotease [Saprospiraceae bacterium]|nr:CPBP family intramembrane metalloprotease [Saprospiraceae bacterium]
MNASFWKPLIVFVFGITTIVVIKQVLAQQLIRNGINGYETHTLIGLAANLLLIGLSIFLIRKNNLFELAGLRSPLLKKWTLFIFPVAYLGLLNLLLMDDIVQQPSLLNLALFSVYCLSIGFAEELSLRGFMQSYLIKHWGRTKRQVMLSIGLTALFFGVLHFIKFDQGLYGEMAQVVYASFIGIMFGALLVITRRIYPLIVIHAIVDFIGDYDAIGLPIPGHLGETTSPSDALLITLLVLPCFLYGAFLMKRHL